MADLATWLIEQIEDDERVARGFLARTGNVGLQPIPHYYDAHIYCMAPARVLADCESKRRVVDLYRQTLETDATMRRVGGEYHSAATMERVLLLLAQPYADRPGFDESWRVE